MKSSIKEDNDRIMKGFEKSTKEAEKMIKDKEETKKTLNKAFEKLNSINDGPIKKLFEDVLLMIEIVSAYIKGEYKSVPINSIIAILGALIYLISPIDVIPDFLPGVGYIDDAFVIALVLKMVHEDLQAFKNWKLQNRKASKEA